MKRKICVAVLTVLMLFVLIPAVFAGDSGTCGDDVYWELENGVLTIYGTGRMYERNEMNFDFDIYEVPWFQSREEITDVVILDGVTNVANRAFWSCTNLINVSIPDSVTSIGYHSFSGCVKLTSIELPDGLESIGNYAFSGCEGITSITIPDGVIRIGNYALSDCDNLTSITIPDGVTSIGDYAFSNCENLTSVTIPASVTGIGTGAFSYCGVLESIDVDSENQYYSNDDAGVLYNKEGTVLVVAPKTVQEYAILDTAIGIEDYAFADCKRLTRVTLPAGVTSIGANAFRNCDNLTNFTIPDGVSKIGSCTFFCCKSLTSITIPDGVTNIEYRAFYGCENLTRILIPDGVTSIGNEAFHSCGGLTSIMIPDGVTSIGDGAFVNCYGLTSIVFPTGVTSLGKYALSGCKSLKAVSISSSVTHIADDAFKECYNLERIDVDSENQCYSSDAGVLYNKGKTTLLKAPGAIKEYKILDTTTSIKAAAFSDCTSLTSITFPEGLNSIGNHAFSGCKSLTSITLLDGLMGIGDYAFYSCESLTSVTLPDGLIRLGEQAFAACRSLTDVLIPDGVTRIRHNTFWCCSNLREISIPKSVAYIESNAFYGCSDMTVYYSGTRDEWNAIEIGRPNEELANAIIYYGDGAVGEHPHSWDSGKVTTKATCTTDGVKTYTCKICGETKTETISATGHNWGSGEVTKEPAALESGVKTYTCSGCGETKTEKLAALNNPFDDLVLKSSYYDPVLWAVDKGITKGTSATEFSPKAECTRAQIVTFLWRYAGSPEPKSMKHNFVDIVKGSSYYKAVIWAVEKGITTGTDATHFSPKEPCTRAQIVTFLWRYAGKPQPSSQSHNFTDIVKGSSYYDAVLWAVEKGITTGADTTHFAPKEPCTRAQGMTFLYRYNK